jgi:glycerate 2-kinase
MSAPVAAAAMERGVRTIFADAECIVSPMADGGEGTVDALVGALGGEYVTVDVRDGLGRTVQARYGYVPEERLAIIEMAAAAGIDMIIEVERDPRVTSTFGVGQLIVSALDRGARRFVVGLGSSVTNDGGAGMLQALGARLLDHRGEELPPGGAALSHLDRIDLDGMDARLATSDFELASDVTNPLLGPHGASVVFGPQKGADEAAVAELDAALTRWARVIASTTGRDVAAIPGSGAAGGLGAAFLAFLPAQMSRGVDVVMSATHLSDKIAGADYVFTGEGSVDAQTASGKTLLGVAEVARQRGVPVIAFAGRIGEGADALYSLGVEAIVPIVQGVSDLPRALAEGPKNLERAVATVCRDLPLGGGRGDVARDLTPPEEGRERERDRDYGNEGEGQRGVDRKEKT